MLRDENQRSDEDREHQYQGRRPDTPASGREISMMIMRLGHSIATRDELGAVEKPPIKSQKRPQTRNCSVDLPQSATDECREDLGDHHRSVASVTSFATLDEPFEDRLHVRRVVGKRIALFGPATGARENELPLLLGHSWPSLWLHAIASVIASRRTEFPQRHKKTRTGHGNGWDSGGASWGKPDLGTADRG